MISPRISVISLTAKEGGCLGRTTSDTEILSSTRVRRNHRRMVHHLLTRVEISPGGNNMGLVDYGVDDTAAQARYVPLCNNGDRANAL